MAYRIDIRIKDGKATETRHGSIGATVDEVHGRCVAYCEHCGAPLTESDTNDYGSLCETCYLEEYYGDER